MMNERCKQVNTKEVYDFYKEHNKVIRELFKLTENGVKKAFEHKSVAERRMKE